MARLDTRVDVENLTEERFDELVERLPKEPVVQAVFDRLEEQIFNEIRSDKYDGTEDQKNRWMEACVRLHTLKQLRTNLTATLQASKARAIARAEGERAPQSDFDA